MRPRFFSIAIFGYLWIFLLVACAPTETTAIVAEPTRPPIPTATAVPPTYTPDPQRLIAAATLFSTDFENGYPSDVYDWSAKWQVQVENDGNSVFCNQISDEWSSFLFGLDEWENYAISLRVKFLSANQDQSAETYFRINPAVEGYRANIWNNEWASVGFYPPPSELRGSPVETHRYEWNQVELRFVGKDLRYSLNDELVIDVSDDKRASGRAGFGAAPNTEVCVDDIVVWGLDENGSPVESLEELVIKPSDGRSYTIQEKVDNRPTIPVFYPWSGSGEDCHQSSWFDFDCDTVDTPYSLIWTASGITEDIESTQPQVTPAQSIFMRSDNNTLYLISEDWHYWNLGWRYLSPDSKFYLDEVFKYHVGSEYGDTKVINFEHPEWPGVLAEKAFNFKNAGFDGIMLDWWHNYAGNGRSPQEVEVARLAIAKAIREKVGDEFIILGNVNDGMNDPTAQYLSGVFMELWKPQTGKGYALTYNDENSSGTYTISIERMEDLLLYWNTNLQWPKIIAFEPWKITTGDYVADRNSEENYKYAKLFAAMAVVIPDNGYILYADNNDDWNGGDHQHAYYDFYLTDFGKPTSGMIEVTEGVAYKQFERGVVAYNRTQVEVDVTLPSGEQFTIGPVEGLFIEGN